MKFKNLKQIYLFLLLFFIYPFKIWGIQALSLEDVILIGIKNNPQINIVYKIKEQYFYQKNLVRAEFFPYIYLQYTYERIDLGRNEPALNFHSFGPYFNWNIFSGFSTWHNYKSALLLIASQDENIKSTILDIALNIIQAYVEYFKQKSLYEAALADLEDAKVLLKLAKKRYEVGLSPYADVLDAEARVKEAEFNVTNYKYTSEVAKVNVLTLINYDISRSEEFEFLPVEEYKIEIKTLDEYIKLGLIKRPEIKAKEKEILAQEERIKSVKGEFYPYIDLFGCYYKVDSKFFPDKDEEFIAGVRITFPIFLGFSRFAKLGMEKVILDQKKFEKINTELNIKQEIFNSYKAWQTAKENYETALAWLRSMEEDYRIIQKKYESGLASIVDVTTLLARLSQARAKVAVSRYSWIYSQYRLQKSLGMIPEIEK